MISYTRATDLMRAGSCLAQMHTKNGSEHFIVPGGKVMADIAAKLKEHPQVRSGKDGLFPGHDQTWTLGR